MIVIVEGPDKSGKTTLANAIVQKFGYEYIHFGAPGADPGKEYAEFLINLAKPIVCDRFYLGELVYGPLFRKRSLITNLQQTVIERLCRLKGALLIYASTPLEVCQERLGKSKDEDVTLKQNEIAWRMFRRIVNNCNIAPVCQYNASNSSALNELLVELGPIINTRRHLASLANYYCAGIGTIFGDKLVIVGESLNERTTWIGKPFDGGLSSEFLYSCMREAGIDERKIYVTNADKLTIEEAAFIGQSCKSIPWLALGELAHKKLVDFEIDHVHIPHPQYWKRFKSGQRNEYIELLKKWNSKHVPR